MLGVRGEARRAQAPPSAAEAIAPSVVQLGGMQMAALHQIGHRHNVLDHWHSSLAWTDVDSYLTYLMYDEQQRGQCQAVVVVGVLAGQAGWAKNVTGKDDEQQTGLI